MIHEFVVCSWEDFCQKVNTTIFAHLQTLDPQKVTDRYTTDAVLLPTLSDKARYTNDEIKDYFVHFCEKKPVGTITEGNVKIGANWAQDAGLYQFAFADGSVAKGRYRWSVCGRKIEKKTDKPNPQSLVTVVTVKLIRLTFYQPPLPPRL